jgi:hypothetical protein
MSQISEREWDGIESKDGIVKRTHVSFHFCFFYSNFVNEFHFMFQVSKYFKFSKEESHVCIETLKFILNYYLNLN